MNKIYSEKELLPPGLSFGQWEFTLSNDEIYEKLKTLPKNEDDSGKDCVHWKSLLSLLSNKEDVKTNSKTCENESVVFIDEDEPMECSSDVDDVKEGEMKESGVFFSDIEDIAVSLVDNCNQVASKLKPGFNWDEEELAGVVKDLHTLNESSLSQVVEKAWSQLNSDASKICFCVTFCLKSDWCEMLCKQVLVPWISKGLPSKLEQFSEIFSKQSEVFCKNLMAPLLQMENSPLVKDLLSLEEIMTSMPKKDWTILLKSLLSGLTELHIWIIPVLAVVVEHSDPSFDELIVLVQLMASAGSNFAKSRDFGALLVAVAICIKPGFGSVIPQIKLITNNYKGPLKFKVLKVLNDLKD